MLDSAGLFEHEYNFTKVLSILIGYILISRQVLKRIVIGDELSTAIEL